LDWVTGIAVYAVIWWLVIFMVLPWGNAPVGAEDVRRGHDRGAPARPRLLIKVVATTVIAAAVWGIVYWVLDAGLISLRP
jgi:predicted secreted protein